LRGSPPEQQQAHAERLAFSPVPYRGWVLREGGTVLACGQTAREGNMVGLYDVFTAPAARNRGLSRALCAELIRQAAGAGAITAYLQVDGANGPALAVYHRLGFAEGYRYHYRASDPACA
jgi:GNAT superfamily N-acetyltransferase